MIKRSHILIAVVLTAFIIAGTAFADDYHYTNLLIGDRATGMGGAYTAISDDATGLYYNPAGIVYTSGRSLSASVNAYYNNEKTYKGVIADNGWKRRSSSLLPNYFGVVQPVGKFKIGLSYAVPDSIMEDQSQTFTNLPLSNNPQNNLQAANPGVRITSYIINFNNENNVYEFGPSIATELTDNLSAGLTLYYYQKKAISILNQVISTNTTTNSNPGFELTNQYLHVNEQGLRPILGFMWSPANKVSVGLAVSKIMLFNSDTTVQNTYVRQGIVYPIDTTCDGSPVSNQSSKTCIPAGPSSSNEKREFPTQVSLGVAWFPSQNLLFSTDINYFTEVKSQDVKSVANVAIGTEYYPSKNWALRGGAFTNLANTPAVQSGLTNQAEHTDLYGATASISNYTRNTSVTLGTALTYGSGQAQIIGGSPDVQKTVSMGWMLFLSSSYSY